tara:strand:- start:4789 stop:6057 length:1269 start_codon:yes stop_codon:yes gene_type:complete
MSAVPYLPPLISKFGFGFSLESRGAGRPPAGSRTTRESSLRSATSFLSFKNFLLGGDDAMPEAMPPPGGVQLLRNVKEGKLPEITEMLTAGAADVNFQNHYGDSALILACWYGHLEIARLLIEHKADVDMVNCDGNGALNCAAYHGFVNVASLLLQNGAKVDVMDKVTGKTALIKAAYVGHAQVAQMLLQRGAGKDLADNQGYTALAFATSFNHLGVVSVLLDNQANPNVQDEFGITPLIHAAARGYTDGVRQLLRAGAKSDLTDMEGKTAIEYADAAGFDEVVEELEKAMSASTAAASKDGPGNNTARALPAPSPRNSLNSHRGGAGGAGGMTPRMTPRVPNSGDVAPKMTPRMPLGSNQSGRNGSSTARGGENIVIRPEQVATLSRDTLRFLTKKLVHLTVLLEQDTVADDAKYPSFYSV